MSKVLKAIGLVIALVILVQCGLFLFSLFNALSSTEREPSRIVDYAPSVFVEKAEKGFFYSIGDELRFADKIDLQAKILFKGKLYSVTPSPDGQKVLVVSEGVLWLVTSDGMTPRKIANVNSIYIKRKPIGEEFYHDDQFQWASDSSRFYLIKDKFYESKGSQLFSIHGELIEYSIATSQMRTVVAPFRAFSYFVAEGLGVFFREANDQGDVILKVRQGDASARVMEISSQGFQANDKAQSFNAVPFYNFSINEYAGEVLRIQGLSMEVEGQGPRIGHLTIKGRRLISVSEGKGLKGPYFGFQSIHSAFLPGEQYFMLNLNTGTFSGQLLIDIETGQYKQLPKGTRVYRNINTHNFSNWKITREGVKVNLSEENKKSHWW